MPATLYFNGVDAETGGYAFPPASADAVARAAAASIAALENGEPSHLGELKRRQRDLNTPDYAPVDGVDPNDLAQTGWGVIFAHDADPAVKEALKPLLDLRRSQASRIKESRYRELIGGSDNDSKPEFLDRNGAGGGGAVDPDQIPYYLLIVGSPDSIPFPFQYQLDVQYAVGRVCFDDLDGYARYARSVVESESGRVKRAKRAAFFGVANQSDMATALSATELIAPLAKLMHADQPTWKIDTIAPADAMKTRLASLMGGPDTPALLFTASHGMYFSNGSPLQAEHMGALLCGDWPGPSVRGLVPPRWYFSGCDLSSDAELLGMITFHFACFGAATPLYDDFTAEGERQPKLLAARPFVANLPKRLLTHPKGGALACIGHVDRAWGYSFKSSNGDGQLRVFKNTLKRLMEGYPVGYALEYFNNRYAELTSDLSSTIRKMKYGKQVDPADLSDQWTFNNDARNYVIIGDPAVRLPLTDDAAQERKSMIETKPVSFLSSPAAPSPAPEPAAAAVDFGFFTSDSGAKSTLQELASTLSATLSAKIGEALNAVATVQVKTYSTASLTDKPGTDPFTGANLRAVSEIRLDGNARICVPEKDGQIDSALWTLHTDMVDKALANRIEMFKLAASAASSLLGALKQL
jgi:peptidase C25-like protein